MNISVVLLSGIIVIGMVAPSAGREEGDDLVEATLAGGCFWCMEPPFDKVEGVKRTTVGYTGGETVDPTYEEVSSGTTGHIEAMKVVYDPSEVDYEELLSVFFRNIDPFDAGGQFCDRGSQYRSAIFVHNEEQEQMARAFKDDLEKRFKRSIATEIVPAGPFYPAEDYHQEYYEKNPIRYRFYRYGCGRDRRLEEIWGKK
ncbi:MAG: peptide-methionine (S)-S-oxide reductase MsrA [Desulfovibrionales bacterium]